MDEPAPSGRQDGAPPVPAPEDPSPAIATDAREDAYWRANLRLLGALMAIWFACSFGAGILLRDMLDQFSIGGYPLGFWFAQQGSIYIFIILIFVYAVRIRAIEHTYGLDD
jgi:putative solute:sodium symporter small subunit